MCCAAPDRNGELRTDSVTAAAALIASGVARLVQGVAGPSSRTGRIRVDFVLVGRDCTKQELVRRAGLVTMKQTVVEPFAYDAARRAVLDELRSAERRFEEEQRTLSCQGNGGSG